MVDYLIKNGSEQVIREARDNIIQIQTLTEFQHIDEDKDVGLSGKIFSNPMRHFSRDSLPLVRERAKQIVELLHDEKRIKSEREKAKSTSKKISNTMGSDAHGGGGRGM